MVFLKSNLMKKNNLILMIISNKVFLRTTYSKTNYTPLNKDEKINDNINNFTEDQQSTQISLKGKIEDLQKRITEVKQLTEETHKAQRAKNYEDTFTGLKEFDNRHNIKENFDRKNVTSQNSSEIQFFTREIENDKEIKHTPNNLPSTQHNVKEHINGSSSTQFNTVEDESSSTESINNNENITSNLPESLQDFANSIDNIVRVGTEAVNARLIQNNIIIQRTEEQTRRWEGIRNSLAVFLLKLRAEQYWARYLGGSIAIGSMICYIIYYRQLPSFGNIASFFVRSAQTASTNVAQAAQQAIPTGSFTAPSLNNTVDTTTVISSNNFPIFSFLLTGFSTGVLYAIKFLKK